MVQVVGPHLAMDKIHLQQPLDTIRAPIIESCRPLLDHMSCILVTLGRLGLMVVRRGSEADKLPVAPWNSGPVSGNEISATYYPAPPVDSIVSVSGAGDCLAAGFITGVLKGWSQKDCATLGLRAAECSLQHSPAVPEALSDLQV